MTYKQLKHADVETVLGQHLGKVQDVIFETDGQVILQYIVKSSVLGRTEYLVGRDQVVRFEEKKIVVDDGISSDKKPLENVVPRSNGREPEGVAARVDAC